MNLTKTIHYVFSSVRENSEKVCALRGKNKLLVQMDMLGCLFLHHVHPFEYSALGFDSIPRSLRDTYMTTNRVSLINKTINAPGSSNLLTNKFYAGTVLAPFYKRPCLQNINLSYEEFLAFAQGRDKFIFKPFDGYGGEGHKVYKMDSSVPPEQMYKEIMAAPRGVLEGWIVQHETLNKLYAGAVHTIRLHTIHDGSGKDIKVFGGNLSIACNGELANTHYLSTLCAQVDDETGVVTTDGLQRDTNKTYAEIPSTHVKLRGFQLPDWEETLTLVKMAAAAIPEVQFIGWDVAFTPDGPVICEGNVFPGVVNYQHYAWYADGCAKGWWPLVKPYVDKKLGKS
jgi:hypothetical protein